ncbi:hypothetical protein NEMBOFW57_004287 [Staphylotrichum longicolle]|uniref:Jacalin-type lectin domain-containing protein n=1 Tax=Staphylotrichum longicolle TaxID=669026 RepID=A0AAD4F9A6_9PEZI|nr:hypothetical protein NEMBOFW57_004287 [Staphylotrichum longicolle]
MGLLLVPYTNAMRLGQGFNSYTQQICVDDAVVVNPNRAENVLLNDGTTMRILAQTESKPSAWTRQREVIVNEDTAEAVKIARESLPAPEHDNVTDEQNQGTAQTDVEPPEPTQDETTPAENENQDGIGDPVDGQDAADTPPDSAVGGVEEPEHDIAPESEPELEAEVEPPTTTTAGTDVAALAEPNNADELESTAATTATQRTAKSRQRSASVAPSAGWRKLQQDAAARQAAAKLDAEELAETRRAEKERLQAARALQLEMEKEERAEEKKRRQENREEQRKIREEKRNFERERRQETYQAIKEAASKCKDAMTMDQMKAILQQNQFVERFNGMGENDPDIVFDASAPRGPSQTVTYTSRFVDRLSDITDDMCVSGSLSIKSGKIGGSGRGSFIDSDKFKESDLNFYISVKVVNQTVNFKDALEYNPISCLSKQNFAKVYGDSFISGFLEGGEFNALVSMKILNKAKKTDIQAEAKVALTAGPVSVEAQADVGIARENIETNTETTIQVSWCGGGHIKPMEQQWDIKSLMQAAARFPDLVADCPQRTYAVLTKYENLRSFVKRQPKSYSKLAYENAQMYTNVLMDAFMSYKALYKQLSDQIFQVRQKTMEILPWESKDAADNAARAARKAAEAAAAKAAEAAEAALQKALTAPVGGLAIRAAKTSTANRPQKKKANGFYPYVEDNTRFEASIGGLDQARKAIRRQMARIVHEVDVIEEFPSLATDEDHEEPFQPPASFEMRLPTVDIPKRLRPQVNPLTGHRIMAVAQTEEERREEAQRLKDLEEAPALYPESKKTKFVQAEADAFAKCIELNPRIGYHLNVTPAVGSEDWGTMFNNLDFLREDWHVKSIIVHVGQGMLRSVAVEYRNGLIVQKGHPDSTTKRFELGSFVPGERVTAGSIEVGESVGSSTPHAAVLGVRLFTNHGCSLVAEAQYSIPAAEGKVKKDGFEYKDIRIHHFDCPLSQGTLKGFFGRSVDTADSNGVFRLGFIRGDVLPRQPENAPETLTVSAPRAVPSRWGQTTAKSPEGKLVEHAARFGLAYPTPPKVLCAFSEVRGIEQSRTRPVSWQYSSTNSKVSTDCFSFSTTLDSIITNLAYSWLTLPENEVNFNFGIFDFDATIYDDKRDPTGTHQVVFTNPYGTAPAPPAVWCVTMDYTGTGDNSPDGRLRHSISDLTATGFKLNIETWGGGHHAGNVWGWCTWDKEYDGVKVKSESKVVCCGNTNGTPAADPIKGALELWEPTFPGGKQPVSIMTGINGYDINVAEGKCTHLRSQWQGTLENGSISCGVDGSGRARYVSAMYLAILED